MADSIIITLENVTNISTFMFYYNIGLTLDAMASSMGIELE